MNLTERLQYHIDKLNEDITKKDVAKGAGVGAGIGAVANVIKHGSPYASGNISGYLGTVGKGAAIGAGIVAAKKAYDHFKNNRRNKNEKLNRKTR